MEEGVYCHSSDSESLLRCLRGLLNANPFIEFTSINYDGKLGGFKIRFTEPRNDEPDALQRNFVVADDEEPIFIYPLTTCLMVHGVKQKASPKFRSDLEAVIENDFGKILRITKFADSSSTEEWRVQIDVPEFKGVYVFQEASDSFEMTVSLPSWNEILMVSLWCRHCETDGHFMHECDVRESHQDTHKSGPRRKKATARKAKESSTSKSIETRSKSNTKSPTKTVDEKIGKIAEKIGREEVLKRQILGDDAALCPSGSIDGSASSDKERKKENRVKADATGENSRVRGRSPIVSREEVPERQTLEDDATLCSSGSIDGSVSTDKERKKENRVKADATGGNSRVRGSPIVPREEVPKRQTQGNDATLCPFVLIDGSASTDKESRVKADANGENSRDRGSPIVPKEEPFNSPLPYCWDDDEGSYSPTEDEVQVLKDSYKPSPDRTSSHGSTTAGRRDGACKSEEASMSPTNATDFSFPSYSDVGTPGPSIFDRTPSSAAKPSTRVEVTTSLSEQLQFCINSACNSCKVLDRKTLDAFLIHVKKKSNPVRVALNFTKKASDLKDQLKQILHLYYNTPQTGTKEDMQFIKWLNGLVERFDGTIPRKRKRGDRCDQ